MLRVMNSIIMFSSKLLMQIKLRPETSFSSLDESRSLEAAGVVKKGGRGWPMTAWKE